MLNIIEQAAKAGIVLYVEEEQLKYHQLGDEFPEAIQRLVKEQKENIISFLTKNNTESLGYVNILQQLERQVQETPDKIALRFEEQNLSYREFAEQVDNLAKYIGLNSQGKPVALLLDRGINTMIAIYAALRANVTYVPIDPTNPIERINYYLDDSEAALLIAQGQYIEYADSVNANLVVIDSALEIGKDFNDLLPEISSILASSPAYIIYTSGSTGKPKGVVCSHANLVYFSGVMRQQFKELELGREAKWLWNASYAFDASMKSVVSLAHGHTIVVPTDLEVKDPRAVAALIQKKEITVLNTPPVVMEYLLPQLEASNIHVHILVSGDDVDQSLWNKLYEYSNACGRKVINAYGPTEATVNATFEVQTNAQEVSIGRAVEGTQLYILDSELNEVPSGCEGELYISGPGVALGYLNNPEATEASFITLPDSNVRVFKTGDQVKELDSQRIQFIGRNDSQVKYRGYRIELGEIKSAIKQYNGIQDVAVVTNGLKGELRIEAYLVAPEQAVSVADITSYLSRSLPEYMHPTKLSFVEEIPLTVGGKVDKNRLLAPTVSNITVDSVEGGDVATRLTAIWMEVLQVAEVKPENSFFELGGHSLLAMQLLQKIDMAFGVVMETRDLFSLLTLQSQIDWVQENSCDLDINIKDALNIDTAVNGESSNENVELEL